ncbi:hypothetical protein ACFL1G_09995 [Planctomycetota bacterium]
MHKKNEKTKSAKQTKRWPKLAALVVIIILIVSLVLIWKTDLLAMLSPREELTRLEAALAVPDEQNAALIYEDLLKMLPSDIEEPLFFTTTLPSSLDKSWRSKDHLETKTFIQKHQTIIDTLLMVSDLKNCRFSLYIGSSRRTSNFDKRIELLSNIRKFARILVSSANNDLAESRIDSAFEKYLCIFRMSKHFQQQPVIIDHILGVGLEELAIKNIKTFILKDYADESHLKTVENSVHINEDWDKKIQLIKKVEKLNTLSESNDTITNIYNILFVSSDAIESAYKRIHRFHQQLLTDKRGLRLIVALKRYKNQTNHWPQSILKLKSLLPEKTFLDAYGSPFVYEQIDGDFKLYSKGENKIDENGQGYDPDMEEGNFDDLLIWPQKSY